MKIDSNIKEILSSGTFEDNKYFLPKIQLDRKDYVKCNDVLESIGMKWNRGQKAHIGEGEDVEETFRSILELGEVETLKEYRDRFQFFPTPDNICDSIIELAKIKKDDFVLEPSAGKGSILKSINRSGRSELGFLCAVELNEEFSKELDNLCDKVYTQDFLTFEKDGWDKIIMNPPFANSQDVKHIFHAYSLLKDGGKLVSIASSSIQTRTGKLYDELKSLNPEFLEIPDGSFKESGTMVNTCIVILNK